MRRDRFPGALWGLLLAAALLAGCQVPPRSGGGAAPLPEACRLESPGWCPRVKAELERLISAGAGKGLPVVFDFDNTLVCRDIGEATAAVLAREGLLAAGPGAGEGVSPPFRRGDEEITLAGSAGPLHYYEAFLDVTAHQEGDGEPYGCAYAWLTRAMAGLTPARVVEATAEAWKDGAAGADLGVLPGETKTEPGPGGSAYRRPFFYPEMVELVGVLLKSGYDVWVVSASNVWSVRWMVTRQLNAVLAERGVTPGVAADHVLGVSVLLRDGEGRLFKDPLLVRTRPEYAELDATALARYTLTAQLCHPLTGYCGKVAAILKWIGKRPYLVAGDSPNDHAMLVFAENRLWIARLEKAGYQERTAALVGGKADGGAWLLQPVLYKKSPGFVARPGELPARLRGGEKALADTIRLLRENGWTDTD